MDHPTDETLLAYLDGELPERERAVCDEHLGRCGECAAALAGLRSASTHLSEALEVVDRAAGRASHPITPPTRGQGRGGRGGLGRTPRALAKAAVLVIAAAGAAAAAVPGSPVREWLAHTAERVAGLFRDERPAAVQEQAGSSAADLTGVAVALAGGEAGEGGEGGEIRIRLTRPHPDAIVRVRLVDGRRAAVWSERASYRTGPGRIEVVDAGPGELRIEIPRLAREARIEVDGRLAVLKEGSELRLVIPAADSAGAELLFRAGRDTGTTP